MNLKNGSNKAISLGRYASLRAGELRYAFIKYHWGSSMKQKRPTPKSFDNSKYKETIDGLDVNMSELEFERLSEIVVPDILENYEGFEKVEKGPDFRGTPFDFFGFKADCPYIIEYKGSLNSFNAPGETQKRRLQELMERLEGLRVALLQVKLTKAQYRIFYDEELDILFQGRGTPLEPIIGWLKERLKRA